MSFDLIYRHPRLVVGEITLFPPSFGCRGDYFIATLAWLSGGITLLPSSLGCRGDYFIATLVWLSGDYFIATIGSCRGIKLKKNFLLMK